MRKKCAINRNRTCDLPRVKGVLNHSATTAYYITIIMYYILSFLIFVVMRKNYRNMLSAEINKYKYILLSFISFYLHINFLFNRWRFSHSRISSNFLVLPFSNHSNQLQLYREIDSLVTC